LEVWRFAVRIVSNFGESPSTTLQRNLLIIGQTRIAHPRRGSACRNHLPDSKPYRDLNLGLISGPASQKIHPEVVSRSVIGPSSRSPQAVASCLAQTRVAMACGAEVR
jgi:hypothetical protein